MKSKKDQTAFSLNRRKFLSIAGMAAASGLTASPIWAKEESSELDIINQDAKTLDISGLKSDLIPESQIATVMETKVIANQPGRHLGTGTEYGVNTHMHPVITKRVIESDRYMGWPTLARTRSGELIVAVSGDRDAHVCPWGKTQIIRSKDQGKTWSDPEVINNTPLDDRDAGVIETKKGTLVVSWFTSVAFTLPIYRTAYERYARIAEKITPEIRKQWLGNWVRRSEDGGKTWLEPVRTVATAPHGPIQLRDGRLLYIGTGRWNGKSGIVIEESADDGQTWNVITTISKSTDIADDASLSEPHMVELASGKLIAMVRHEPKDRQCFLLQSESTDGGKSWSPLYKTGIWGYPPHLIQLKNGLVVVTYGYRLAPYSERACISRDEGRTWDIENQITLANALGPDMGYPSSVQLDDDSILTAYYQAAKAGGPTVLHSTHWRLK
ncbi:MAG TPA: sialidase family protein [Sphingobacteriaceae bacterium]